MDAAAGDGGPDAAGCGPPVSPAPGLVVTDRGPVQGARADASGAWTYLGVPYAAPPVGALRWKAPAPHACWSSPLSATAYGSACLQLAPASTTSVVGAEDCLTANVFAPASATAASGLPVLFFVHGGGNVQGSSADKTATGVALYDGALLAAQAGVVVVTFNYRLGPMGFLAHAAFAAEAPDHGSGNYGLRDQITALDWVQRNIAAFGGDPRRVLLFGESAGAVDVCALVASPLAKGLFSAALMESGGCVAAGAAAAQSFAGTFAAKVGCTGGDVAACLRGVDATTLELAFPEPASVSAPKQGDFQPNVDGVTLLDTPHKVIATGAHNHVPFVVGGNANETGQAIVAQYPAGMTAQQYDDAVLAYAGGNATVASAVQAMYPPSDYGGDPRAAFIALTTDSKFVCTVRYDARAAAASQSEPVRRYFFTHVVDGTPALPAVTAAGAFHGLELLYVFRHIAPAGYTPSAGEQSLTDAIDGYWSRLAETGDPNGGGAPTWPPYDASTDPAIVLDDVVTTTSGIRSKYCDYWDTLFGR
jgi:para-nitrobenzyl esterase